MTTETFLQWCPPPPPAPAPAPPPLPSLPLFPYPSHLPPPPSPPLLPHPSRYPQPRLLSPELLCLTMQQRTQKLIKHSSRSIFFFFLGGGGGGVEIGETKGRSRTCVTCAFDQTFNAFMRMSFFSFLFFFHFFSFLVQYPQTNPPQLYCLGSLFIYLTCKSVQWNDHCGGDFFFFFFFVVKRRCMGMFTTR